MEAKVKSFMPQNISVQVQPFSRESLVSFKDPRQLWTENWFAVVLEVASAIILFQAFRNAKKNNTKSAYLILAALCAVFCFEILPILPRPGYQLWWYHQGLVNVLKKRLPSYVLTISALVHYMANGLTSRSNLPALTRSFVTAVCASLIMYPCLWISPRLLLFFTHFDDPVFRNQLFGVPYMQIVLLLFMFFHISQLFHQNFISIESHERSTYSYVKCAIQSGLAAGIYALIEQYLLYILFTLTMGFNSAVCLFAAVFILAFLAKNEIKEMKLTSYTIQGIISPLMRREFWIVFSSLLFISTLPLWLNTSDLRSSSDRLELGPCNINHEVANTSPLEIVRRRYVCPDDAPRLHFDFHCLTKKELSHAVNNTNSHYTVCGKSFSNPMQTFKLLSAYSSVCLVMFYVVMLFSFSFKVQEQQVSESCKKVE